ncbi:MAG: zinc ribbon domain-containing protein [Candidatus Sericytochromatia bacterium]|nr:zinc ribbon domain-containing protein [Candidatus Sericytochromatia bacterium]
MPIYEYRCEPCHQSFEVFLATSSEQAVCPRCQGTQLQRLMSSFATVGSRAAAGPAPSTPAPRSGGCGGGCSCH